MNERERDCRVHCFGRKGKKGKKKRRKDRKKKKEGGNERKEEKKKLKRDMVSGTLCPTSFI